MQKGTLYRMQSGEYVADVGNGPESDQVYTQEEAREVTRAWHPEYAKDVLQKVAHEKLRASNYYSPYELLDSMLPANQCYVDTCGGTD